MTLCAVISVANDFPAVAKWSAKQKPCLARSLSFRVAIPSDDRFNATCVAANSREFEMYLHRWITSVWGDLPLMPAATKSPPFRNCWNLLIFPGDGDH